MKEQYDVITEWYAGNHTVASQEGMADCMAAFKNFLCWYNFPRCSPLDVSLVMCRSVCDNMMTAWCVGRASARAAAVAAAVAVHSAALPGAERAALRSAAALSPLLRLIRVRTNASLTHLHTPHDWRPLPPLPLAPPCSLSLSQRHCNIVANVALRRPAIHEWRGTGGLDGGRHARI